MIGLGGGLDIQFLYIERYIVIWVAHSMTLLCRVNGVLHEEPTRFMSYQVISNSSEIVGDKSTEEKYLIATSEQPLCALHRLVGWVGGGWGVGGG